MVASKLQACCKLVVSLLQASLKLPPSLFCPILRPSTGAIQPASSEAAREAWTYNIDSGRGAKVTGILQIPHWRAPLPQVWRDPAMVASTRCIHR